MSESPTHHIPLQGAAGKAGTIPIDRFRKIVFPNRLRELRMEAGHPTLAGFAAEVADIPYIRLSKIERGEVFARSAELQSVAEALEVTPTALLIDTASHQFDIAHWATPFGTEEEEQETELAILLAAAFRQRRADDPSLTLAALETDYSLPPVIVSRIENAVKAIGRWKERTLASICTILGVDDPADLASHLQRLFSQGDLDEALLKIPGAADREERTRERVSALRRELSELPSKSSPTAQSGQPDGGKVRILEIIGSPLADGLISDLETGQYVAGPSVAGPRSYALRIFRSPLGPGLPANALLFVDPDQFPVPGGLAVIRQGNTLRLVSISTDREGVMTGFSVHPELSIAIDALPLDSVAAVIGAAF